MNGYGPGFWIFAGVIAGLVVMVLYDLARLYPYDTHAPDGDRGSYGTDAKEGHSNDDGEAK